MTTFFAESPKNLCESTSETHFTGIKIEQDDFYDLRVIPPEETEFESIENYEKPLRGKINIFFFYKYKNLY